ncbi:MAG: hypothetical protein V8S27_06990 [Lachnospiraceae bacterium]
MLPRKPAGTGESEPRSHQEVLQPVLFDCVAICKCAVSEDGIGRVGSIRG